MTKEGQRASKATLAAQAAGFVQAAFHARHGVANPAHADEGRAVFTAGEAQPAVIDLVFSVFGRHGFLGVNRNLRPGSLQTQGNKSRART